MTLRTKFVIPVNLILGALLAASLAWEFSRMERGEYAALATRLEEEARFIHAASDALGTSDGLRDFLDAFCHATDVAASPGHQVTVVGPGDEVLATAAAHVRDPIDPTGLAQLREGSWLRRRRNESYLIRVSTEGDRRVVVAESTGLLRERVRRALTAHAAWILGLGTLLLAAINGLMSWVVLRPVRRLHNTAMRLEQGELGVQVDWSGNDELGSLSERFNAMSRALAMQAEETRRELEAASRVQSHSLPPPLLELDGVRAAGRCTQRGPVGGDVYDVQPLPGSRVAILVADFSGHDISAALNTAMLRAMVWHEAEHAKTPGEVLGRLNEQLCRYLPAELFATAVLAWFDTVRGSLHYANAGHPTSYAMSTDAWHELDSGGPVLGLLEGAEYPTTVIPAVAGMRLFAYTDGVTETRDPPGRLWGMSELTQILKSSGDDPISPLLDRILGRLAQFRADGPQEDDVTLVLAELASR